MNSRSDADRSKDQAALGRRAFVAGAAAIAATAGARRAFSAQARPREYRVGVIGHTGRGNYGHGLDTVWREIPNATIVAVADANPKGLDAAVKRLKAPKGYADYRKMLEAEKPDLVSICPRHLDQHHDMLLAAVAAGVRGIYCEKPLCRTLAEADEMIAACDKRGVKCAVSHQTRYSPKLRVVREMIKAGQLGRILEFRGRGKEDGRGGGEDLWVLGTHVLDLIHTLGGDPQWCFATVHQNGRPIRPADVKPGKEGIGPLAGDEVHAMYRLASGAVAYFDSIRGGRGSPTRFGLCIHGTKGVVEMHTGHVMPVHFLPDSSWSPGRTGKKWVPVSTAGPGKPETMKDGHLHAGNVLAVQDLIAAVEKGRQPESSIAEARTAVEMIVAVFESQRQRRPVPFPLTNRQNPLAMLE